MSCSGSPLVLDGPLGTPPFMKILIENAEHKTFSQEYTLEINLCKFPPKCVKTVILGISWLPQLKEGKHYASVLLWLKIMQQSCSPLTEILITFTLEAFITTGKQTCVSNLDVLLNDMINSNVIFTILLLKCPFLKAKFRTILCISDDIMGKQSNFVLFG